MRHRAQRSLKAVLDKETLGAVEVLVVDIASELPRIQGGDAASVIYLEFPDAPSLARAKLLALPKASAELIAIVEDHVFVEPGWAAGVLKGFKAGADVAVYTFRDATPEGVHSRALGLMSYGRWMSVKLAGEHEHGPGNNVAYRKSALLRQGDRLEELMHIEVFLHWAIREQGGKIYQEASEKAAHAHWDNLSGTLRDICMCSRVFAHQRRNLEIPSLLKRLVYVAALPLLLPTLNFRRTSRALTGDRELLRRYYRHSPLILFFGFWAGISEAIGYFSATPHYREHLDVEVNIRRACDPPDAESN